MLIFSEKTYLTYRCFQVFLFKFIEYQIGVESLNILLTLRSLFIFSCHVHYSSTKGIFIYNFHQVWHNFILIWRRARIETQAWQVQEILDPVSILILIHLKQQAMNLVLQAGKNLGTGDTVPWSKSSFYKEIWDD